MVLIIGLTGPPGSGKGSVAEILAEFAQDHKIKVVNHSLSDEIREEIKRRGIELNRDSLKYIANQLRRRMGSGVWALSLVSKIEKFTTIMRGNEDVLFLVDGIRNPVEVYEFRTKFGSQFKLLGITAPSQIIYKNLRHRGREDESRRVLEDKQELQKLVEAEMGLGEPGFGHNVAACLEMADWPLIQNNGSLKDLKEKVQTFATRHILPLFVVTDRQLNREYQS